MADLPTFFEHQKDPKATHLAAFAPREKEAFMIHWTKILANKRVTARTILHEGKVAGNLVSWSQVSQQEVGYWLGREYWGQGIATAALKAFLEEVEARPLYAHVAERNFGSIRVLEKCGFNSWKKGQGMTGPEGEKVKELVFILGESLE